MDNSKRPLSFLLASIVPHTLSDIEAYKDIKETVDLIKAYGGKVREIVIQRREVHDKGMYLGLGKIEEIAELIIIKGIDVVVLNEIVKPGHIYEIKNMLRSANKSIKVWDRIDLILHIFSSHANTAEARLQIELASMRHMGPRIYGMGFVLSRQGGSIGTRGIGETNTELMRRHWRNQMKKVHEKLNNLAVNREHQLARRVKMGLSTVSIIGYTNAGKTSLFNLLSGKSNMVNNALFVTLDSSVGKIVMPHSKKEVLVTDTIGFIKNLPAELIEAFKSTLMESMHADILLHVIDASDEDAERKIDTVEEILKALKLQNKKIIYIFNKTDDMKMDKKYITDVYSEFNPQFISVKEKKGIDKLLLEIEKVLFMKQNTSLVQNQGLIQ